MDKNPIESLREMAELDTKPKTIIDKYLELFLNISSEIKDSVYLKGNVLLNQILRESARTTKDLDLGVVSKELYYTAIVPKLKEFGDIVVRDGIAASYIIKEIQEHMSGGIDVKDHQGVNVYSVDVSLSGINPLGVIEYEFSGSYAYGSSINKILADKCLSTLSRKRFRRVKDFYDIFIIEHSGISYDASIIYDLMLESVGIDEVSSLLGNQPFSDDVLKEVSRAWDKLKLFSDYYGVEITKPNISSVVVSCYNIYQGVVFQHGIIAKERR